MALSDEAERQTIRRPDEPSHFMRIKPVSGRVLVSVGDSLIADSSSAKRLLEHGHDLYDPVIYLPREDVKVVLQTTEKTTHCPLKGDTTYYDACLPGERIESEIAWSYTEPLSWAQELDGLVAFDAARVAILEKPND
jgi:uncharacterized protein (DUF427 family)